MFCLKFCFGSSGINFIGKHIFLMTKEEKEKFIIESLQHKSNAILSFIVIQSLVLAYQLAETELPQKISKVKFLYRYIMLGHFFLSIGSIVLLFFLGRAIHKYMDAELRKVLKPRLTSYIKIVVAILFTAIPIIIMKMVNH